VENAGANEWQYDRARSYEAMVRFGGADLASSRLGKCGHPSRILFNFLLQNAEHPKIPGPRSTKGDEFIPVSVSLSYALLHPFRQLSEGSQASVSSSVNADPKLSVETGTQLAVFLANRPGALARVCDVLANAESILRAGHV